MERGEISSTQARKRARTARTSSRSRPLLIATSMSIVFFLAAFLPGLLLAKFGANALEPISLSTLGVAGQGFYEGIYSMAFDEQSTGTSTNVPTPGPTGSSTPVSTEASTPPPTAGLTAGPTGSSTPVSTSTSVPTPGPTAGPTGSLTPLSTGESTPVPTPGPTSLSTPVPTGASTPVPTATSSSTPVPSGAPTPVPTATSSSTPVPSGAPTPVPTATSLSTPVPSGAPTPVPTATSSSTPVPSGAPTPVPTSGPTAAPTGSPTSGPTVAPTTKPPTDAPTTAPTDALTKAPTDAPTRAPTDKPTRRPTKAPTDAPTRAPIDKPTRRPTKAPTDAPTKTPTHAPTPAPTDSPTPHVVFFLIDDQGFDDMGYQTTSNDYMKTFTPNLDAYAATGVKLNWYYSDHLCSPSRASIMTGKNLLHNGVQHDVFNEKRPAGLSLAHKLLPQYMNEAGYVSHAIGKWHLGFFNGQYLPTNRGFESYFGYYGGNIQYYAHYGIIWGTEKFYDMHNGESIYGDTSTFTLELFDQRASEVISAHDDEQPMFLYYATQGIHGSFDEPPPKMLTSTQLQVAKDTVYNTTESIQREYLVLTSAAMDTAFANLIDHLKEKGMYENSVIIVASDNGGCSHNTGSNYPLRGEKNTLFEGGLRVNAFVHSPLFPEDVQGTTLDCMVHNVDWLPTILKGAVGWDGDLGPLDGVNHWDGIVSADKSAAACPRAEMIHQLEVGNTWQGVRGVDTLRAALRMGDLKLVYGQHELGWWSDREFSSESCDATNAYWPYWGYVFDLSVDPSEKHNLMDIVDDYVLSRMWQRLDYYFVNMANPSWRAQDINARTVWSQNDFWIRPWVSDEDLVSPRDPWQEQMKEGNTLTIHDGHNHPERDLTSRTAG